LKKPLIREIINKMEETSQGELERLKEVYRINRESILLGLQTDVEQAEKISDRIAARLGQAKILGLTKESTNINVQQGIFGSMPDDLPAENVFIMDKDKAKDTQAIDIQVVKVDDES